MVGKGKLALIENAKDYYPEKVRQAKVDVHHEQFKQQGFDVENIDLRDFFGDEWSMTEKMKEFSGIFVFGGNTFILRRAMANSGLDTILQKRIPEGKLAYGGSSAGSMVMTPDLNGPDWSKEDRADVIPKGYNAKVIWQGLNLVPFYIVPHFGSEIHGDSPQRLAGYYKSKNLRHYVLKDGQVVVVNSDKVEVLK